MFCILYLDKKKNIFNLFLESSTNISFSVLKLTKEYTCSFIIFGKKFINKINLLVTKDIFLQKIFTNMYAN